MSRFVAQVTIQTVAVELDDDFRATAAFADYFRTVVEQSDALDKVVKLIVKREDELETS